MKSQLENSLAVICACCMLFVLASPAHAGLARQGHGVQGHGVQGHGVQGSALARRATDARAWLQGQRLIVVRAASSPENQPAHGMEALEIVGFHGDQVLAFVWTASQGWRSASVSPHDLVGLSWLEHRCESTLACERVSYRIAAAAPDATHNTMPEHPENRDIWLYRIEYTHESSPGTDDWHNVCPEDAGSAGMGLFVDGRWNPDGSWQSGGYTFACTSGVVAKCARTWGYKPWKQLADARGKLVDMRPLHQACTRAARADYCGDGISHTRDGTLIDMFDIHGFNRRQPHPGFAREAGFTPNGARWVARERWPRRPARAGPWTVLPTCRRLESAPASADDPVLVHVFSRVRRAPRIAARQKNQ